MAFIVVFVGVAGYGWANGQPHLLLTTWDADSNGCGYNETTKDYPFLYFPALDINAVKGQEGNTDRGFSANSISDLFQYSTCVKSCPKAEGAVECSITKFMKTTEKDYYKDCVFHLWKIDDGGEPFRYETSPLMGKFCVPSSEELTKNAFKAIYAQFQNLFGAIDVASYIGDVAATADVLLISLASAFLIGFVYMIVLRLCGGPIIYLSIVAMILGTAFGGYMLFDTSTTMATEGPDGTMSPNDDNYYYYLYGSYTVWGISAVLLCCAICNLKNIRIGVAVMKCTAAFLGGTPQVFLMPIVASAFLMVWLGVWCIISIYIVSIGELKQRTDGFTFLSEVVRTDETNYMWLYTLFGYLWINAFIIGVTQFIISAAAAIWYFSCSSDSNGSGSLMKGFYWVFRYHLGSIAVGSFLIALVQFIRIIFEYYKKQIQKMNKGNPVVKVILCCTSYLLDCLERFIKFISKNAYIQIAITGKNFCSAAWNAFILIIKNALRFGTANSIGFIFNVIGVAFITAANFLIVYVLIHYVEAYKGRATNWITPCVVGGLEGLMIGSMFMSVFSFASDTILQSFLVDEELNRPDGSRPAIMNQFIEGVSK